MFSQVPFSFVFSYILSLKEFTIPIFAAVLQVHTLFYLLLGVEFSKY